MRRSCRDHRSVVGGFGEQSRDSSPCISNCQRVNSVSDGPQLVHPGGIPISHSANLAFNCGREVGALCENVTPSGVVGAGTVDGENASAAQSSISNRLLPSERTTAFPPPLCILAVGVGQFAAIAGKGVPPAPKLMFGPPLSPSDALGVAHKAASRDRLGVYPPCIRRTERVDNGA